MRRLLSFVMLAGIHALACSAVDSTPLSDEDPSSTQEGAAAWRFRLGAHLKSQGTKVEFRVRSAHATRIEVYVYAAPMGEAEIAHYPLVKATADEEWSVTLPVSDLVAQGLSGTIYYGYRAWGPNWTYDASWGPGSTAGFVADVDDAGNRFDPNKLLLDPYALEVSHDPRNPSNTSGAAYATGNAHRAQDSGPVAPKGIVISRKTTGWGAKPTRAFKDEVIYEVHVRGFTMADPSVPAALRGTFAGAATKAAYLQSLGVTAVEFLPLQETQNDTNDMSADTGGDNYWGYATLDYFAPDRRYSSDKSPGGPTKEFRAMVKAMHDVGIKVYADVVFNHTGEGGANTTGDVANLISWRGLDNASYYELGSNKHHFYDNTGTGANFNAANDIARDLVVDALWYWQVGLGIDGFRFDLAPVLGNTCESGCFHYDKAPADNALNRAADELPVRPAEGGEGVDLIAEPWAIGGNSYQVGGFPAGWAEWNGKFRDTVRKAQNAVDTAPVAPRDLARRIAGSSDLYKDDGRRPWHSVNFVVAHDGFTMRDLYAYNDKNNGQPWPYGPSSGGSDSNYAWDQGGDHKVQRMASRTGLALLMLSAGVPMITGGDEVYRTVYGNNNPYNLDSDKNWLDWSNQTAYARFADFTRRLIRFRLAHPALRPADFFTGKDHDGNGRKDITWYGNDGIEATTTYKNDAANRLLAYLLDGEELGDSARSIYVAYNGGADPITLLLPASSAWYRVGDTAVWMESQGNFVEPGHEKQIHGGTYDMAARSLVILLEP